MNIINQDAYELDYEANKDDPYGKAILDYAQRWADLMESKMLCGLELQDVVERASREADIDGITGFMYGLAVAHLYHCWVFGDELRRWSNSTLQLGSEGDRANEIGCVLNPALLSITV